MEEDDASLEQIGKELGLDVQCLVGSLQTKVVCEELTLEGRQHIFHFATPDLNWN